MTETTTLHRDVRRLLDLLETLVERDRSPLAAPIEDMLADLHAIRSCLSACAIAMQETARQVEVLVEQNKET
jgi:hypothetical protein